MDYDQQPSSYEIELSDAATKMLQSGKYELAINSVNLLLKIRPNDPNCYLALGDCFKGLYQFDEALDAYWNAMVLYNDPVDFVYAVEDDFDLMVSQKIAVCLRDCGDYLKEPLLFDEAIEAYMKSLEYPVSNANDSHHIKDDFADEIIEKISVVMIRKEFSEAFDSKDYDTAISSLEKYLLRYPDSGETYARLGMCYEDKMDHVSALKNYEIALTFELSHEVRYHVELWIKLLREACKVQFRQLVMSSDDKIKKYDWDTEDCSELIQIIQGVPEAVPYIIESTRPVFDPLREAIHKEVEKMRRSKSHTFLIGSGKDGFYAPNMRELLEKIRQNPDEEFIQRGIVKNPKTGEVNVVNLRVGSRLARWNTPVSGSKLKELERKRRYYYNHREKLLADQKKYDEEHRVQNLTRYKLYYLLRNEGSRTYNREPSKDEQKTAIYEQSARKKRGRKTKR